MYQILIKGGTVIDPANSIHEVLNVAVNEVDASGCLQIRLFCVIIASKVKTVCFMHVVSWQFQKRI